MPPTPGCPQTGPAYPEVTRAICLVPSASFSQAPWYAQPVHLCRFRVRSICRSYFLDRSNCPPNPIRTNNVSRSVTSGGPRNIDLVPIGYGSRPRLRGRLTLRGLTLRRNPWTFGERVSHSLCRYSCQHSHFRYLHRPHQSGFTGLGNAPLPRALLRTHSFGTWLEPRYIFGAGQLIRPVSYYAFFKGWLLLSQPPGCFGRPTSFPT